jgi:hypothetical protein
MHTIAYPLFALKGNPYLNDLFWIIYDRLATFTPMGAYSVAPAERGVTLTQDTPLGREEFPAVNASVAGAALQQCLKVSSNRFGNWHEVTLPPMSRFSSAWLTYH